VLYIALSMISGFRVMLRGLGARLAGERGQDLIEYALLSGLIAATLIAVGTLAFSGALNSMALGMGHCMDFDASTPCEPLG
jgi:Flp pilus assembly pilin Flp